MVGALIFLLFTVLFRGPKVPSLGLPPRSASLQRCRRASLPGAGRADRVLWGRTGVRRTEPEISATTAEADASARDEVDQGCGVCGEGPHVGWGAFLGEHTIDTGSEVQAWAWLYEGGKLVFLAGVTGGQDTSLDRDCFILDTRRRVPYCGACADELKSDQGLSPSARLTVLAS
jgi:hypothetical protein